MDKDYRSGTTVGRLDDRKPASKLQSRTVRRFSALEIATKRSKPSTTSKYYQLLTTITDGRSGHEPEINIILQIILFGSLFYIGRTP